MLTNMPVVKYHLDLIPDLAVVIPFFEKALNGHLCVRFVYDLLINKSGVKNKWDTFFAQLFILVNSSFKLNAILCR